MEAVAEGEPLPGGNLTAGVVRVGSTVRRPAGPWTPAVDALLTHLNAVGFEGAPRTLGFDREGRHVLEFVEGEAGARFDHVRYGGEQAMLRVGRMIRSYHEAVAAFTPPVDATWNVVIPPDETTLIAHHDLAPWNLVRGGNTWVFIDWDNAGPGSPLWDLAYAAHGFVPLAPTTAPSVAARRLTALVDGYGLAEQDRRRLPALIVRRTMAMHALLHNGHQTGTQPWSRLWNEGHGDVWAANADYAEANINRLTEALLNSD